MKKRKPIGYIIQWREDTCEEWRPLRRCDTFDKNKKGKYNLTGAVHQARNTLFDELFEQEEETDKHRVEIFKTKTEAQAVAKAVGEEFPFDHKVAPVYL